MALQYRYAAAFDAAQPIMGAFVPGGTKKRLPLWKSIDGFRDARVAR